MRRELELANLDDAVIECDRLLETGYTKSGNWSLAQICCHIRLTMERNMNGYPKWMVVLGYPLRPILRALILPKLLSGASPSGIPTASIFVPPEHVEDKSEVDQLKQCVANFNATDDAMHGHPGFGNMSNEEFNRFHAAHAAHHLSFLHPKGPRITRR